MTKQEFTEALKKAYDFGLWHGIHIPSDPLSEWSTESVKIREEVLKPLVDNFEAKD